MSRPKFECTKCGEGFAALKAFDAHLPPIVDRRKQGPCLAPEDVGLVRNAHGWWSDAGDLERARAMRIPPQEPR